MSKVYLDDVALTNDIRDEKRAVLAYNMFRSMAGYDVWLGFDGVIDTGSLRLVDENGVSMVPEPDKEWFGTRKDNDSAREAVLDVIIEEMKMSGADADRDFERELMDSYTVRYRSLDITTTYFMHDTWDIDKARDMYSIMTRDLAPDISLVVYNKFEDKAINITEDLEHIDVVNMDGDVYDPEKEAGMDLTDTVEESTAKKAAEDCSNGEASKAKMGGQAAENREREGSLQFGSVGYFSNVNQMAVQYANGAKNKPEDFSYDKLMNMGAMQEFLDKQNAALTEAMNQKFGDMFESVKYDVRVLQDGLSPHLLMVAKDVLSTDMKKQCDEYLEIYQKKFAKDFNRQPFTKTEYGFAKFPSTNKFGIDLLHDESLAPDPQRLTVAGSGEDKYKEIIAAPNFTGGCNYYFKFDKDKWPDMDDSLYYTKNGTMRESHNPIMEGVKAVLKKQGRFDSVDEITIYSDQSVVVTMPPIDDSSIISIADDLGDCGRAVKTGQYREADDFVDFLNAVAAIPVDGDRVEL